MGSTWGNCHAQASLCLFFLAVPMKWFGGGGAFCQGGAKLSFPEGLHGGKTSSTCERSCLLVLSTSLAEARWSHMASLFPHVALQHLALCSSVGKHNYTWASSSAGEGMNASCLHLLVQSQRDGEKLSQGGGAFWRRACAASCFQILMSPKGEGRHLHYRYKCWKMGNFSHFIHYQLMHLGMVSDWWPAEQSGETPLSAALLLSSPTNTWPHSAPNHHQNSGYTLHVNL